MTCTFFVKIAQHKEETTEKKETEGVKNTSMGVDGGARGGKKKCNGTEQRSARFRSIGPWGREEGSFRQRQVLKTNRRWKQSGKR